MCSFFLSLFILVVLFDRVTDDRIYQSAVPVSTKWWRFQNSGTTSRSTHQSITANSISGSLDSPSSTSATPGCRGHLHWRGQACVCPTKPRTEVTILSFWLETLLDILLLASLLTFPFDKDIIEVKCPNGIKCITLHPSPSPSPLSQCIRSGQRHNTWSWGSVGWDGTFASTKNKARWT